MREFAVGEARVDGSGDVRSFYRLLAFVLRQNVFVVVKVPNGLPRNYLEYKFSKQWKAWHFSVDHPEKTEAITLAFCIMISDFEVDFDVWL
jgi:hypothetical protein